MSSTPPAGAGWRQPGTRASGDQILAAAAERKWILIDMAADWATIHPPDP
jgi:hypothetical protein